MCTPCTAWLSEAGLLGAWAGCRYVVDACRAAKSDDPAHEQRVVYLSVSSDPYIPIRSVGVQTYSLLRQSAGANASSPFLYAKSKGLTELALARLGYSETIVFRPGLLKGAERADKRLGETVFGYVDAHLDVWSVLSRPHFGRLATSPEHSRMFRPTLKSRCVSSRDDPIEGKSGCEFLQVPMLAKAIMNAGLLGSSRLPAEVGAKKAGVEGASFTLIDNKGSVLLSRAQET